jgi:hypothetical protein
MKNQSTTVPMKCTRAARILPCARWPKPGKKKLASAAMTFPADPCPVLIKISKSV